MRFLDEARNSVSEVIQVELPTVRRLVTELRTIDWSSGTNACGRSLEIIKRRTLVDDLQADFDNISPECSSAIAFLSRETGTHFKWCLSDSAENGFKIWMHEFKSRFPPSAGFSISVHNHRYPFASRVLLGGYTQKIYGEIDDVGSDASVVVSDEVSTGDHYLLSADDYHSLANIRLGTVSLIIEGPPAREYSEVLSHEGERRRHYDLAFSRRRSGLTPHLHGEQTNEAEGESLTVLGRPRHGHS